MFLKFCSLPLVLPTHRCLITSSPSFDVALFYLLFWVGSVLDFCMSENIFLSTHHRAGSRPFALRVLRRREGE